MVSKVNPIKEFAYIEIIFIVCAAFSLIPYITQMIVAPIADGILMKTWEWAWMIWLPFYLFSIFTNYKIYGRVGLLCGSVFMLVFSGAAIFL